RNPEDAVRQRRDGQKCLPVPDEVVGLAQRVDPDVALDAPFRSASVVLGRRRVGWRAHGLRRAERELVLADAASGAIERRIALQGWTRGLAVDNGVIYVGESADRVEPAPGQLASVATIERETWSVVDRIPLPCEEVFDVIEVPASLARAVRTGFRTNPLRAAEQDQHSLFRKAGVRPARLWAVREPLPASACRIHINATLPERHDARTNHDCDCMISNLGNAILVSAPPNPVHISYRWRRDDETIEGLRSMLPG